MHNYFDIVLSQGLPTASAVHPRPWMRFEPAGVHPGEGLGPAASAEDESAPPRPPRAAPAEREAPPSPAPPVSRRALERADEPGNTITPDAPPPVRLPDTLSTPPPGRPATPDTPQRPAPASGRQAPLAADQIGPGSPRPGDAVTDRTPPPSRITPAPYGLAVPEAPPPSPAIPPPLAGPAVPLPSDGPASPEPPGQQATPGRIEVRTPATPAPPAAHPLRQPATVHPAMAPTDAVQEPATPRLPSRTIMPESVVAPRVQPPGATREGPAAPVIRVTIGRIEVRTQPPPRRSAPAPAPAQPRSPALSLEDYLEQRNGGRR